MNTVLSNLNRQIQRVEGRTVAGMLEGAAIIRRDMDKTEPLIPVDRGYLRASWFATPIRQGIMRRGVLMGFTANYSVFVHEEMEPENRNWKRPGSGPKFFEASIKRNGKKVLLAIQRNAFIG